MLKNSFYTFALVLTTVFAKAQQFYVVVVGVSDYIGTQNDLHFADDDAQLVYSFFSKSGVPSSNMKLLLNS